MKIRLAVCACVLVSLAPAPGAPALGDLLVRYDRGEFVEVVRAMRELPVSPAPVIGGADKVPLDPLFLEWLRLAPRWIDDVQGERAARRRLVAASFALELARARAHVNWYLRYPFVAWACGVLRHSPTPRRGERLWHLAAIGVMEENDDWPHIVGGQWTQMRAATYLRRTLRQFFGEADYDEATTGHLAHARLAVPDETRWQIAEAHYEETRTSLEEGPLGIGSQQVSAARRDLLARAAAGQRIRPPEEPIDRASAKALLERIDRVPAVIERYRKLNAHEELRGDVALRLGFLRLRLEEWDAALADLREVPHLTQEPALVSLSHHFAGWIFQQTNRRAAAIDAYRRALAVTPRARSTSILLAAQLADAERLPEAYVLVNEALMARPSPASFPAETADAPLDPWPLYSRGDALLLPTFITRLREALR